MAYQQHHYNLRSRSSHVPSDQQLAGAGGGGGLKAHLDAALAGGNAGGEEVDGRGGPCCLCRVITANFSPAAPSWRPRCPYLCQGPRPRSPAANACDPRAAAVGGAVNSRFAPPHLSAWQNLEFVSLEAPVVRVLQVLPVTSTDLAALGTVPPHRVHPPPHCVRNGSAPLSAGARACMIAAAP